MKRRLLIIDTEEFDRNMMCRIFGSTYSMAFSDSTEDATKVMKDFNPEVVYFELRQTDTAQFLTLAERKENFCPRSALIVVVSENSREFERFIRSRDVFYYMLRPFNLKELWDAVESGFRSMDKYLSPKIGQ